MYYITNSFNYKMLRFGDMAPISYPLSKKQFIDIVKNNRFQSAVGHGQLAFYLSDLTGEFINYSRMDIKADYDDKILYVPVKGRLQKGKNVRYKDNLEFWFIRFKRQTIQDIMESERIIKGMEA